MSNKYLLSLMKSIHPNTMCHIVLVLVVVLLPFINDNNDKYSSIESLLLSSSYKIIIYYSFLLQLQCTSDFNCIILPMSNNEKYLVIIFFLSLLINERISVLSVSFTMSLKLSFKAFRQPLLKLCFFRFNSICRERER